ncbi:S-adenosyl-L-methionine-dependent methyltransferase [Hymenopellis radicata]|nr:S-adenosyl-L-methionine-dependent methyltransferase [Hymenopellis radicata]
MSSEENYGIFSYSQLPATSYADWERTDHWFNSFLIPADPVLDAGVANAKKNGLPDIAVSASQGKFLYLLAKSLGVKRIIELGTLGGYSTTWLARALPDDGEHIGLELEAKHAKVAEENVANAGLGSKVKFIVGPALASLKEIPTSPKFDLAFIDADWEHIAEYFQEAKRIVRSGGVIIVDNVVQNGEVSNFGESHAEWAESEGVRRLVKAIQNDKEVEATVIGTVGDKGYDGFLYAIRK